MNGGSEKFSIGILKIDGFDRIVIQSHGQAGGKKTRPSDVSANRQPKPIWNRKRKHCVESHTINKLNMI